MGGLKFLQLQIFLWGTIKGARTPQKTIFSSPQFLSKIIQVCKVTLKTAIIDKAIRNMKRTNTQKINEKKSGAAEREVGAPAQRTKNIVKQCKELYAELRQFGKGTALTIAEQSKQIRQEIKTSSKEE